jgi:hypothetical protein
MTTFCIAFCESYLSLATGVANYVLQMRNFTHVTLTAHDKLSPHYVLNSRRGCLVFVQCTVSLKGFSFTCRIEKSKKGQNQVWSRWSSLTTWYHHLSFCRMDTYSEFCNYSCLNFFFACSIFLCPSCWNPLSSYRLI